MPSSTCILVDCEARSFLASAIWRTNRVMVMVTIVKVDCRYSPSRVLRRRDGGRGSYHILCASTSNLSRYGHDRQIFKSISLGPLLRAGFGAQHFNWLCRCQHCVLILTRRHIVSCQATSFFLRDQTTVILILKEFKFLLSLQEAGYCFDVSNRSMESLHKIRVSHPWTASSCSSEDRSLSLIT